MCLPNALNEFARVTFNLPKTKEHLHNAAAPEFANSSQRCILEARNGGSGNGKNELRTVHS